MNIESEGDESGITCYQNWYMFCSLVIKLNLSYNNFSHYDAFVGGARLPTQDFLTIGLGNVCLAENKFWQAIYLAQENPLHRHDVRTCIRKLDLAW